MVYKHINNIEVTLHRNDRVLEITEKGNLRMVDSNKSNGTKLIIKECIDINMRRSLFLYYKNKPFSLKPAKHLTDVEINLNDSISYFPHIIEKELFKINSIAILDSNNPKLALDDYMCKKNGIIKWWDLYIDESGLKIPTSNQWFIVKKYEKN